MYNIKIYIKKSKNTFDQTYVCVCFFFPFSKYAFVGFQT
jgi:hypothetical protein